MTHRLPHAVIGCFWPLFVSEMSRKFCGQSLPSLAHLNLGLAPSEPPYTTHRAHFSVHQNSRWKVVKKRENEEGVQAKKTWSDSESPPTSPDTLFSQKPLHSSVKKVTKNGPKQPTSAWGSLWVSTVWAPSCHHGHSRLRTHVIKVTSHCLKNSFHAKIPPENVHCSLHA